MKRRFIGLVVLFVSTFVLASPAAANDERFVWCKTDPVVRLDGTLMDITVSVPPEYLFAVDGPTEIVVKSPEEVDRELILNDFGFMAKGSVVRFIDRSGEVVDGQFPITVDVSVPVDEDLLLPGEAVPVEVSVFPQSGDGPRSIIGTHKQTRVSPVSVKGQY